MGKGRKAIDVEIGDSPIGLWVWDVDANQVFSNGNLSQYFGMKATDAAGGLPIEAYLESVHDDDREGIHRAILEAAARGRDFRYEYRVRDRTGKFRHVVAVGKCFVNEDGSRALFPGWVIDLDDKEDSTVVLNRLLVLLSWASASEDRRVVRYILEMSVDVLSKVIRLPGQDGRGPRC